MNKKKNIVRESKEEVKRGAGSASSQASFPSELFLSDEIRAASPSRSSRPSAQLDLAGKKVTNPYKRPEPRI